MGRPGFIAFGPLFAVDDLLVAKLEYLILDYQPVLPAIEGAS